MMQYFYVVSIYLILVLISYAVLKMLAKYINPTWQHHIILKLTTALISFMIAIFILSSQWKYLDLIIKDDHRICNVKTAHIHDVLPKFKNLLEIFKKDVIELLKHQIKTKSHFLQLIQNIKQQSYEIYHISLDQQLDIVDIDAFMTCMEQKMINDRQQALDEAEEVNAEEAKIILDRYRKIEENLEIFKKFKKSEKDIRFEIDKLNQQLEEKKDWLNKTTIENTELLKDTSIYFKANIAKILDINVNTLKPLPRFE